MKKLLLAASVCSFLVLVGAAPAGASTPTLKNLAKNVATLQKQVKAMQALVTTQTSTITVLQGTVSTQATTIATLQSVVGADNSHGLQKGVADIAANPALALSWLPTYLSLDMSAENGVVAPNIVFKGCNLHVMSSTSETDNSGLGNLIVGWDSVPSGGNARTGSNNLVAGDGNNFSNCGGFLAGVDNSCTRAFASVSGGADNWGTSEYSSVSGGENNSGSGFFSSVSGGRNNTVMGSWASISGGGGSVAGSGLTTTNDYAWKAGNTATPGTGVAKYAAP